MVNTLYFQEKRNLLDLPQLSGKLKKKGLKNDALTNIVKAHDIVWNIVVQ